MDPLYLFLKTPEDAGANFCIDQLVVKTMAQPAAAKHPAPGQHCWDSTGHNSPALSLQFSLFLSSYLSIPIPNIWLYNSFRLTPKYIYTNVLYSMSSWLEGLKVSTNMERICWFDDVLKPFKWFTFAFWSQHTTRQTIYKSIYASCISAAARTVGPRLYQRNHHQSKNVGHVKKNGVAEMFSIKHWERFSECEPVTCYTAISS